MPIYTQHTITLYAECCILYCHSQNDIDCCYAECFGASHSSRYTCKNIYSIVPVQPILLTIYDLILCSSLERLSWNSPIYMQAAVNYYCNIFVRFVPYNRDFSTHIESLSESNISKILLHNGFLQIFAKDIKYYALFTLAFIYLLILSPCQGIS